MKWTNRKITDDEEQPMPIIIAPDSSSGINMRVVDNKIFFYDEITNYSMLELVKVLSEMDTRLQNTKNILGDEYDPIIHLRLNTPGGEIYSAISVLDLIPNLKCKLYTYVDGCVASAGTFISLMGDRRFMGPHAFCLIHQLSGGVFGKFSEMEDTMENCMNLMKFIKGFYKDHTKIPMKKLDELLKRDLFLSAEECLQFGIIDEIK